MRVSKLDRRPPVSDTAIHTEIAERHWRMVRHVTGPMEPHDTKQSWDCRAANKFGVLPRRIRAFREGRVKNISAVEHEKARRLAEAHRQRERAQLEQQVATAYARCRDDKDAFVRTLVEIVGPRHWLVTKLGGVEAAGQEDGEG